MTFSLGGNSLINSEYSTQFTRNSKNIQNNYSLSEKSFVRYKQIEGKLIQNSVKDGRKLKPMCKHNK